MTSTQALLLPLDGDLYAIANAQVREVVANPQSTPVPSAPDWVTGLINLRGEVVPILDTALLLHLRSTEPVSFAIVVRTSGGPAALTATGMPEFVELHDDVGSAELSGAVRRYRVGDRLAVLIDVDPLLAAARGEALPIVAAR